MQFWRVSIAIDVWCTKPHYLTSRPELTNICIIIYWTCDWCVTHKATLPDLKARIHKCLHNYIMNLCQRIKAWRLHFFRVRRPKKFNSFIIRDLLGLGHSVQSSVPTANPSHPHTHLPPFRNGFVLPLNIVSQRYTRCLCSLSLSRLLIHIYVHISMVYDLLLGWSVCMQLILWSTCIGETSLSIAA
jgi:hypothetical protein